jgi:tetratricopeptide (TPR) repeat protein
MPRPLLPAWTVLAAWAGLAGFGGFAGFAGWPGLPSLPFGLHLPIAMERWLVNPRERTGEAIAETKAGKLKEASAAADAALRLAPAEALVRYNDGTAHLGDGDRKGALPLLEKAAREADRGLAPAAWYNLGNTRLAAGDAAGAVDAYKQALRRAPHDMDAKHNLELALRERQKQQMRAKSPQSGDRGDKKGEQGSSNRGGTDAQGKRQSQSKASDSGQSPEKGQDQRSGQPRPGEQPQRPGPDGRPLSGFRDQPEMSAQEAAALLQSVENLERQQRRRQAAQRAHERAAQGIDW